MTAAEFEAAGLLDPAAPDAADRLALLEWLVGRGVTLEQMQRAAAEQSLTAIAADLGVRPGRRYTPREVAARHGIPVDKVMSLSLATGLPAASADDPIYNDDDVGTFGAFHAASGLFGENATRRFIRVVGSSLARIAEAAVTLFQVNVEGPLRASGGTDLQLARENLRAIESLDQVDAMLRALFKGHMERAIRRLREARPRSSVDTATLAIGFVDLVGYTTLSHQMTPRDLGEVVERFEETAHDLATARGGRVVKVIGDEVMFVTPDATAACDIALSLVERFAGDPSVTPRGGIARGELLLRGGDYYGVVVNLASRIAQLAVPSELLVTPELAAHATSRGLRFEAAGKRMLKGFGEPVALLTVDRA